MGHRIALMLAPADVRLRSLQPECARDFDAMRRQAWQDTDATMLELCRARVAQLLGADAAERSPAPVAVSLPPEWLAELSDWAASSAFDDAQRAHLAVTEQYVTAVGDLAGSLIDSLLALGTEAEVYAFLAALYVVEMELRMQLAARALLDPVEGP